jgi:hypothetical protein
MAEPAIALGVASPTWPLRDQPKRVASYGGRAFGADRKGGRRNHAGVDMLAPRGATVVAPEAGVIVATQRFNGLRAHAVLLQTDTGPVILLGEVEPGSWAELGHDVGTRVERGQPIATVGVNPGGSTMLHLEMYREGTTRNHQWWHRDRPPPELLDPTRYLEAAAAGEPVAEVAVAPEDDHDHAEQPATPTHDPGSETMSDDEIDFDADPVTGGVVWVDRMMTPAQAAAYHAADYRPPGLWNNPQTVCAQDGGTYHPASAGVAPRCHTADGTWCDAEDYMLGRCKPGDVPAPSDDPVIEDVPGIADVDAGDDVDPWDIIPAMPTIPGMSSGPSLPWWAYGLGALALVYLLGGRR